MTGSDDSGPALLTRARGAASNAAWNAFSTLATIVISFVIAPLLIHKLGTDQYGILLLIWSMTGLLGLVGFGFGEATLRYVARYLGAGDLAGVNRVMGATLTFYFTVSVVVCAVLFLGAPRVVDAFRIPAEQRAVTEWLVRLSALVFVFRAVTMTYGSIPMALARYDIASKINVVQGLVRSAGYIALALLNFGLLHIVLWDLITQLATLAAQSVVVRRIAPGVNLVPRLSFAGLREIVGFSVFSFMTYAFLMMHRESAKLVLGAQIGPGPVAHLGTPDNVAQRIHMVVASGSETLMPRFSAEREGQSVKGLLWHGTWASLAVSLILLVPLAVLMPDFLRLWISPEFAKESAALGQFVALSYITQGAYTPAAAYFRGIGRPGLVTVVVAAAGFLMLGLCAVLVPQFGAIGAGYAYAAASVPALFGVAHAWLHVYGRAAAAGLLRMVVLPLAMAGLAAFMMIGILDAIPAATWLALFALGSLFAALTAVLLFGADWLLGGADAPSRQMIERVCRLPLLARLAGSRFARRAR